jgi:hypothetical protein
MSGVEVLVTFERKNFFSFIIKPSGEVVPAMPDEEEFSIQQIRDHVAGRPEVICETREGFLLFRNRDARADGFHVNAVATAVYTEYSGELSPVIGRVFLAHPDHVPPFWRRTIHGGAER